MDIGEEFERALKPPKRCEEEKKSWENFINALSSACKEYKVIKNRKQLE